MDQARKTLNKILVHLFNDILKVEEKSLSKGLYKELTITDMHTIEAVGFTKSRNMSSIAKTLSITVGTLTIAINHLVKKGFVERIRSSKDRRVVLVSLTKKGKAAFKHHLAFHDKMVEKIIEPLNEAELKVLVGALQKVDWFFQTEKDKLKL